MEITNKSCNQFRKEFKKAVKDLEKEFGVCIELGNIRGDKTEFRTKMTVSNKSNITNSVDETRTQKYWDKYCEFVPSMRNKFGAVVNGHKIVGIKPSARKNWVIIENVRTGKEFVCSPGYIKQF